MLKTLVEGTLTPAGMADLSRRLRSKIGMLTHALDARLTEYHRFWLRRGFLPSQPTRKVGFRHRV